MGIVQLFSSMNFSVHPFDGVCVRVYVRVVDSCNNIGMLYTSKRRRCFCIVVACSNPLNVRSSFHFYFQSKTSVIYPPRQMRKCACI